MAMKKVLFVGIAVLIVAGLVWKFAAEGMGPNQVRADRPSSDGDKLPVAAVLSVRPGVAAPSKTSLASSVSPKLSPVVSAFFREF
jgi:hypothetical protein